MSDEAVTYQPLIAWGAASRALPGQTACGDLHLIKTIRSGVLLAVVDGLGHGDEATAVAKAALAVVDEHSEQPLEKIVRYCHEALVKTRGAVMTLAKLRPANSRLSWLSVGNVEGALIRAGLGGNQRPEQTKGSLLPAGLMPLANVGAERVLLRSGIVGYQLPKLHATSLTLSPGDLLLFATDGINSAFTDGLGQNDSPQQIADQILERHCKGTDDALVLAVRYLGPDHE